MLAVERPIFSGKNEENEGLHLWAKVYEKALFGPCCEFIINNPDFRELLEGLLAEARDMIKSCGYAPTSNPQLLIISLRRNRKTSCYAGN